MFIKDHQRYKDGKNRHYYSLCETIRTERGPRHRSVCYVGELNSDGLAEWQKTTKVVDKNGESKELLLFPDTVSEVPDEVGVTKVRLDGVRWERARNFGEMYLGWSLWQKLGLDEFFRRMIDEVEDKADVPWSLVAAILAINRLCEPRSELFIDEQWYRQTALDDIVGVEKEKVQKDRLYRCLDLLIKQKDELEKYLKGKWGELFETNYDVLLYDLTSTYFEGQAKGNAQAKRGYSRDHRPDCKQVIIALIVNREGFPFAFEVMDGNRRDVTTLKEMLDIVENKYGVARRVWVFDRGVVSEENLRELRRRKTPYVVGTPRSALKDYESELISSSNWQEIKKGVEVYTVKRISGEETYVLVRSKGRLEKEKAMRALAMKRLEVGLKKLSNSVLKGRLKNESSIHIRLGKLFGRYPAAARFYKAELKKDNAGKLKFNWSILKDRLKWKEITEGTYLIRANIDGLELPHLWEIYMQLTEAEAAFRAIKSELSIRPIWHHKEERVQAHIMVAFLGYALWVTLKHSLKGTQYFHPYDYDVSPWKALQMFSNIKSGDIILPVTNGKTIRLRRVSTPDQECKLLLERLKIKLPQQLGTDTQM